MSNTTAARPPGELEAAFAAAVPEFVQCHTRSFAGRPESVGAARAWVTGFLPGSPAADGAALMTSELVTNAILYSASRVDLRPFLAPGSAYWSVAGLFVPRRRSRMRSTWQCTPSLA